MNEETVIFEGEHHSIPTAPITLIFGTQNKESIYPERTEITSLETINHFNILRKIDPYSASFFKIVVKDFNKPVFIENISSLSHKHLIGLFSLSLRLLLEEKKFVWKNPENFLHPRYQANLADVLIIFSNLKKLNFFIDCVNKGFFDSFVLSVEKSEECLYSLFESMWKDFVIREENKCETNGQKKN